MMYCHVSKVKHSLDLAWLVVIVATRQNRKGIITFSYHGVIVLHTPYNGSSLKVVTVPQMSQSRSMCLMGHRHLDLLILLFLLLLLSQQLPLQSLFLPLGIPIIQQLPMG